MQKMYSYYGLNDFVVCLGYKGYLIKAFFSDYYLHLADITFDVGNNSIEIRRCHAEPWRVALVDTGPMVMHARRLHHTLGYEDLIDHDDLRLEARCWRVLASKLTAQRGQTVRR